ncbi:alpha/beta fold hydrolase [Pseudonocardia spinosispora]|uniref:alpha/beta fold hydrolase n=1 Tax=Pseudonocardia spinosispora TaxID=103441 RepID=UPI0004200096|nr:alpha/beta hydrolase [Pseudonocardia spinosispora]
MPCVIAPDGARLHYRSTGSGQPLVLLHGWTMNGRFFDRNIDALAARHQVVTVDLRGHGRSEAGRLAPTMGQLAQDLRALLTELGLRDVVLAGWSMGATVVYNYLDRFGSDRLAGIAEIDMTPCLLADDTWEHAAFGDLDPLAALAMSRQLLDDRCGLWSTFVPAMFAAGSVPEPGTVEWWSDESLAVPDLTALALWSSFAPQDWRPLLPRIDVPVLLAHGARSQVYPTPIWEFMAKEIPTTETAVFEDSGHAPFWEESERFNRTLTDFIAQL